MKKITLFALAALTATSAFAAVPQIEAMPTKSVAHKLNLQRVMPTSLTREAKAVSRADEDAVMTPLFPTYRTFDALYLGSITKDFQQFYYPFGFVPASGDIKFYPLFDATSYNWEWEEYTSDGILTNTSNDKVLTIPSAPFKQYGGPTLTMATATGTYAYNDSVAEYFAGGYPGMYSANFDGVGVTPVRYTDDLFWPGYSTVDYDDKDYNENGTLSAFGTRISKTYADCTDFKLTGVGSYVPGSVAPYLLKGGYAFVHTEAKKAAEVKIAIMPIDANGKINTADTIGVGTMMIAEGQTHGYVDFTVSAVDEILGLSTDAPVIVPTTGVYMSFYGINDPEVFTVFGFLANGSNRMDAEDYNNDIYDYLFDWNATLEFDCKNADGDEIHARSMCTALWYANDEKTELYGISEYLMCYDVEFPFIANCTQGFESGDLTIVMPVEGGFTNRFFEANVDIMQLIEDEYVTVEETGDTDWYVFDTEPDDEYPTVFNFLIEAEALPEGVEGRKATISFKGYGFDNTITIIQGTPASINEVVAAKAKDGKVYDLQGRAVKNATKGIYIVDGKKTILR